MNTGINPQEFAGTEQRDRSPSRRAVLSALIGVPLSMMLTSDNSRPPRGEVTYASEFPELFVPGSLYSPQSEPLLTTALLDEQREYFLKHRDFLRDAWQLETTIDLGDRMFKASIIRGDSDSAVVSAAEYGNPFNRLGIVRQLGVRALVDPNATSIWLPANIRGQNNLNYSPEERALLRNGDNSPFHRRVDAALAHAGIRGAVHAHGLSQSADFIPGWAVEADHDVRSVALVETPFAKDQWSLDTLLRFAQSGGDLELYQKMSRLGIEDEALTSDGRFSLGDFIQGALFDDDNKAMFDYMGQRRVEQDVIAFRQQRPDAGLVTVWGGRSRISPRSLNTKLAHEVKGSRTETHEAHKGDHVLTNAYAVVAAASLRASLLAAR